MLVVDVFPMKMAHSLERELVLKEMMRPRLCYLSRGDLGYGFHLHGERTKGAQYIRKIDPGSPAELSGLRSGDRLVEVNGENVERDSHHIVSSLLTSTITRHTSKVCAEEPVGAL